MADMTHVIIFISVFVATLVSVRLVLAYLRHKAILDMPNQRSSHTIPTPRGGGIGILIVLLPTLWALNFYSDLPLEGYLWVILCACALAALSWLDDLHNLGPAFRFFSQIAAVTLCLFLLPETENGYLGGFLPLWIEKVILGLGWVWFINLFNFMDGINGISGVEVISIALGIIVIATLSSLNPLYIETALVFGAAALGFLHWNWHMAKVFMGDVGSVPLGFLLGWILILLAGEGYIIPAVIIALYYLADATLTLLKRALRKEKVWQAHREHFYQKATQAGLSHRRVSTIILGTNLILILCACIAIQYSVVIGLAFSIIFTGACLAYFSWLYSRKS